MATFSRSNKATIAGYFTAIFNAIVVLDLDNMDYNLPSTWVKIIGAIGLPIAAGHMTEIKKAEQ